MAEAFHAPARAVVERNRPVLERVGRRYRLGVVSNFTGNLAPCLDELGLTRLFTAVSDSAVGGAAKPDPRVFLGTLAALGAPADRAWMGGDNFEADIGGGGPPRGRPPLAGAPAPAGPGPPRRAPPAPRPPP